MRQNFGFFSLKYLFRKNLFYNVFAQNGGATTFIRTTLSVPTLSIMKLTVTLSINEGQYNGIQNKDLQSLFCVVTLYIVLLSFVILSVDMPCQIFIVMLSFTFLFYWWVLICWVSNFYCYSECWYAENHNSIVMLSVTFLL